MSDSGMNMCEAVWWEREADEAIERLVEVWKNAPEHAHRARIEMRWRLLAALDVAEAGIDVTAVMQWEDDVENAGVFASTDDLIALLAHAPTGADTSIIRGVLNGHLTAGGVV